MPRILIKLTTEDKSYFGEWSTVVDAPTSPLLPLEEFKKWYINRYEYDAQDLEERLTRVMRYGTSLITPETAEELIRCNRAGKNETELTKKEIIEQYS